MEITVEFLRTKKACPEQLKVFKKMFGDGAELTLPNLKRAVDADLRINWLASQIMDRQKQIIYAAAVVEAWEACNSDTAGQLAVYKSAKAKAFWNAFNS